MTYVRSLLENAQEEVRGEGVRCPMHATSKCRAMITPDAVRSLMRLSQHATTQSASFAGPLNEDDINRFDRFTVEATLPHGRKVHCPSCEQVSLSGSAVGEVCECPYCSHRWNRKAKSGQDSATSQMIRGTSKPCPNCGVMISHYHGHGCHHISPGRGCPGCGQHFCYACLRRHGKPGARKWHPHCQHRMSSCKSDNLEQHLRLTPYPHDARCGCPICPECRPGKPCPQCHGTCVVCRQVVPPAGQILERRATG